MQAGIVREAFVARHAAAVVARDDDDGVLGQAVLLQFVEAGLVLRVLDGE